MPAGLGEIVRPVDENVLKFLRDENTAYRIVHFHLRGSGFSQIPPENEFDKYLRTSLAVHDIERIREDVFKDTDNKDHPWDAIVGYSYVTILAHLYAHTYKEEKVRKLILIGPLSMHKFKNATPEQVVAAFGDFKTEDREIRQEVFVRILNKYPKFAFIEDKNMLGSDLGKVIKQIEEGFGSDQFIFEQYDVVKDKIVEVLGKHYSRDFFAQLRELRKLGWQDPGIEGFPERQIEAARVISVGLNAELALTLGNVESGADEGIARSDEAYRSLYVMQIYDGFRARFLKAILTEDKVDIRDAIRAAVGRIGVNRFIEKVGESGDKPRVWDPAEHKHSVPTLILKGESDPVTVGGQAEHYCENALMGPRNLLKLKGVGHGFHLPVINIRAPYLIGSVLMEPTEIAPGQTKEIEGFVYCDARIEDDPDVENDSDDDRIGRVRSTRFPDGLEFEEIVLLSKTRVSVLVRNSSFRKKKSVADIQLIIRHPFFDGTVVLDDKQVPPRNESWVSGRLRISYQESFTVGLPKDFKDMGLQIVRDSVDFSPPNKLMLKVKNPTSKIVNLVRKEWIYKPKGNAKFFGPSQGEELNSRNALIYAFLEMEFDQNCGSKRRNSTSDQTISGGKLATQRQGLDLKVELGF